MEFGNVNSKHLGLALNVKSVLDPCEDENDDIQDDDVMSLGADSMQGYDSSETDSEDNQSQEDRYIVAPVAKRQPQEDTTKPQEVNMDDEASDDTQDPKENEHQFSRIKDWISSCHLETVAVTDVLSNFPDISVVQQLACIWSIKGQRNFQAIQGTFQLQQKLQRVTAGRWSSNIKEDNTHEGWSLILRGAVSSPLFTWPQLA